jgi:heat shock protein HtpX
METPKIKKKVFRRIGWILLTMTAVGMTTSAVGMSTFLPIIIVVSIIGPVLSLLLSKSQAIEKFDISLIDKEKAGNDALELINLIEQIGQNAGLAKTPEIGIYKSDDINAFATGRSKDDSLIAFSSSLIESMDNQAIAGVAAHEVSHIANGDMVTMVFIQSIVTILTKIITLPIQLLKYGTLLSKRSSIVIAVIAHYTEIIVSYILLLLGTIVTNLFSRKREYAADNLAAELVGTEKMVSALERLDQVEVKEPDDISDSIAALMVSNKNNFFEIFSTHPDLQKRITKLTEKEGH